MALRKSIRNKDIVLADNEIADIIYVDEERNEQPNEGDEDETTP